MNNIDGRRLSDSIREEIRFKAIKDWNAGMSPTNLAHKHGTSRKIVYQWIDRYNQGGWDGLKTRTGKTGPKPSDKRIICERLPPHESMSATDHSHQ